MGRPWVVPHSYRRRSDSREGSSRRARPGARAFGCADAAHPPWATREQRGEGRHRPPAGAARAGDAHGTGARARDEPVLGRVRTLASPNSQARVSTEPVPVSTGTRKSWSWRTPWVRRSVGPRDSPDAGSAFRWPEYAPLLSAARTALGGQGDGKPAPLTADPIGQVTEGAGHLSVTRALSLAVALLAGSNGLQPCPVDPKTKTAASGHRRPASARAHKHPCTHTPAAGVRCHGAHADRSPPSGPAPSRSRSDSQPSESSCAAPSLGLCQPGTTVNGVNLPP